MFMSQSARPAGLVGLAVLGILIGAASAQAAEPQLPPQALWTQTAEAPGSDTMGMTASTSQPEDNAHRDRIGTMVGEHNPGRPGAAERSGHAGGFGADHDGHGGHDGGGHDGGGHGGGGHGGR
jgi:hypothetical protein